MRVNSRLTALIGLHAVALYVGKRTNMKKTILVAAALATVAAAAPAAAQNAAVAASPKATAGARLIKPLTLTKLTDLNFGTIVMGTISADQTVTISGAGVVSCGASGAGLTCTNTAQATASAASYRVTGTQGQVVVISSSPSTLSTTNGGGASLAFTPIIPGPLTLQSSGSAGNDFNVGGSIVIKSSTVDGVYTGDIDVQVAYQ
jgi:ABC-type amino acid transport substrate-binding protein